MTVRDFVERTHVKLHSDGKHLILNVRNFGSEERQGYIAFCKDNKEDILAFLKRQKERNLKKTALSKSVYEKIGRTAELWDTYTAEWNRYAANGYQGEEPIKPIVSIQDCYPSLTEQELAFYKASVYAKSYDPDKAKFGESAKNEIADASGGYETIILKMKEDWLAFCIKRSHKDLEFADTIFRAPKIQYLHKKEKTG